MSALTQETKFSPKDYSVTQVLEPPQYKYSKIASNLGSSSVAVTTTGVADATFRIPTTGWNPARSYIQYDVTSGACTTAGNTMTMSCDAIPLVESVNLITESGTPIINKMQYVREYLKVMNPRQTTMKEYLQSDPSTLFYPSNKLAMTGTAANEGNSQWGATGTLYGTATTTTPYIENQHYIEGADSKAWASTGICFAFSSLKNTFLAVDKTVVFPENLDLTIQFGYTPHTYTPITITDSKLVAEPASDGAVANIYLYLCMDENTNNVKMLQEIEAKEGLRLHIPSVEASMKAITASTTATDSLEVNASKGKRLRKIYLAPFTRGANGGAWLDNSNFSSSKIVSFWTQFNNKRLQNFDHLIASYTDWKEYRKNHPTDDAIVSRNYFYYNYAILEEFDGGAPVNNNVSAGMPLTNMQYTFDLMANVAANITLARFVIYEKDMIITNKGVIFA